MIDRNPSQLTAHRLRMKTFRLPVSIALLSAAIIAFQLALIQILSIMQWYHFAYMVISVALLGFGAAGSLLAIFRKSMINHYALLVPILMILTGIAMSVVTDVSQITVVRFDSYLMFSEYTHIGKLFITYLSFFVPFFLGALAIGLVFVKYVDDIGKIYFANLLGSGAGGVTALLLIWFFFPNQLPALIAIFPVLAGLLIIPKAKWHLPIAFALAAGALSPGSVLRHLSLSHRNSKTLTKLYFFLTPKLPWKKQVPTALFKWSLHQY